MRSLGLLSIAGLLVALAVVLTRDPEEAAAVALVILATGVFAGGAATVLQLRQPRAARRAPRPRRGLAVRRGALVGAAVAVLMWLRAVDGLSAITAGFVVLAFLLAETILSARPHSAR